MTEPNTSIKSPEREEKVINEPVIPSTPERKKRSSSIVSNSNLNKEKDEDIIPKTPPSQKRKLSTGTFQSPADLSSALPPATPSLSASGRFRLSNVPQTPFSAKGNLDLSTSPLKSPSNFPRDDNDESEKPPIRQISSTLKARLSYAFVKYQHGWANQSLDDLERSMMNKDADLAEPFHELVSSQQKKGDPKTYEEFWNSTQQPQQQQQQLPQPQPQSHQSPQQNRVSPRKNISPSKVTKPNSNHLLKSPTKAKIDHVNEDDDGSANRAFLQAISKSRSPKRRPNLQNNLRIDANKYQQQGHQNPNPNQNPEAEAIESLMSLSSPRSLKPKLELNNQGHQLPRQKLSFGESLSGQSRSASSSQHGSRPVNEHAIETESDTEYEQSNTTDEEDISTQEISQTSQASQSQPQSQHSNDTKIETDDDVDIRTESKSSKSP